MEPGTETFDTCLLISIAPVSYILTQRTGTL